MTVFLAWLATKTTPDQFGLILTLLVVLACAGMLALLGSIV